MFKMDIQSSEMIQVVHDEYEETEITKMFCCSIVFLF